MNAKPKPSLSPKRQRFVDEYLKDLNATQAAIRAGYSAKSAYSQAHDLLKNPEISEAIAAGQAKASISANVTAERVLLELARLAFLDPRQLYQADGTLRPIKELPDDVAACLSSIEVTEECRGEGENRELVGLTKKVRLWDKPKALALLCKHLNLTPDHLRLADKDGNALPVLGFRIVAAASPEPIHDPPS